MKRKADRSTFENEAALCTAFIAALPEGWIAYPETCGFDIVLLAPWGATIAVEAKQRLNVEVLVQAMEEGSSYRIAAQGPDFRAVLVPSGTLQVGLSAIAQRLGITVIQMFKERRRYPMLGEEYFQPGLPSPPEKDSQRYWSGDENWHDCAPWQLLKLPDYVPNVAAGHSAPTKLTEWKIRAIKIAILATRRGWVARPDFKHIQIDHRRWLSRENSGWLIPGEVRGQWVPGPALGVFQKQHPANYAQIEADYDRWRTPDFAMPAEQKILL